LKLVVMAVMQMMVLHFI